MSARVVLLGATGYTGELAARAMVRRGLKPVLAGRRRQPLKRLAEELGGLETALANVDDPRSVRALVEGGDVLTTTVGPMSRLGRPALDAAVDAGAHYIDSSGESGWVRHVFESADGPARSAGSLLLPAFGYDSVPGNLAASLAVDEAGAGATHVRVGYFVSGAGRGGLLGGLGHMSGGSRATFTFMALQPSFAWLDGRLVDERGSKRVGVFEIDGRRRLGVSFGTSEAFSLPRIHPSLEDVEVYFGWFENASRLLQVGSIAVAGATRWAVARKGLMRLTQRLFSGSAGGPADTGTGSLFVAEARSKSRQTVARVRLEGINGYVFTGNLLAWAAEQVADGKAVGVGARGPLEAFDRDTLLAGVRQAGIVRVGQAADDES